MSPSYILSLYATMMVMGSSSLIARPTDGSLDEISLNRVSEKRWALEENAQRNHIYVYMQASLTYSTPIDGGYLIENHGW